LWHNNVEEIAVGLEADAGLEVESFGTAEGISQHLHHHHEEFEEMENWWRYSYRVFIRYDCEA
jgi:hypothetical protein